MNAPEIECYIPTFHNQKTTPDEPSVKLMDKLFMLLDQLEPCGDDSKHILWLRAERGPFSEFVSRYYGEDYETEFTEKEMRSEWRYTFPEKYIWYKITTTQYKEYRTLWMNGTVTIGVERDGKGWPRDYTALLEWLISETEHVISMISDGIYHEWLNNNLPYRYRTGTVKTSDYWRLYPGAEKEHFKRLSREDCRKFCDYLATPIPEDTVINEMTFGKYLDYCYAGYAANKLEGYKTLSAKEMYTRHADDRDGGLSRLDPDSVSAFNEWYDLPSDKKWKIENPSHEYEVIEGSSRTRMHLFPTRKDNGWILRLSTNEFCCPEYAVHFYNALRAKGLPVYMYNADKIAMYISGEGKIGIVPCFYEPSDFFYGGFEDKAVGNFIHLPTRHKKELIALTEWYPLISPKLK